MCGHAHRSALGLEAIEAASVSITEHEDLLERCRHIRVSASETLKELPRGRNGTVRRLHLRFVRLLPAGREEIGSLVQKLTAHPIAVFILVYTVRLVPSRPELRKDSGLP
jgi:hypothetical protein